jgi:hypothetical protein
MIGGGCEELSLDYHRVVRDFHERGWFDHEGEKRQKTIRLGTTTTRSSSCFHLSSSSTTPHE